MSFSSQTKNQISQLISHNHCCQMAEFLALTKTDGVISINSSVGVTLKIVTENVAVAKKIFKLTKELFDRPGEVTVFRKNRLKKNNVYTVEIPPQPGVDEIMIHLGLKDRDGRWNNRFRGSFPSEVLQKDCCKRAYLRGAFLGSGSMNNPEGAYHLEIVSSYQPHAEEMRKLLEHFGIHAKICLRKNKYVLYLKDGDQIVEFLTHIGAHQALLAFENERIRKDLCNNINRQRNFDMANVNKTVAASEQQRRAIEIIEEKMGLDKLPKHLQDVAELRMEYPEMGLAELAEMADESISKSGIRHRLKKLQSIADELLVNAGQEPVFSPMEKHDTK
ncbi:MAG TPA: DNA-binding protein WhiA [Firmicutes bacterium]|nr:DNA-binding protein WhiA [Bacillota bacterium]